MQLLLFATFSSLSIFILHLGTVCKYAATDFLLEHPPTIRHMVSYVTDFGQADGIGYLHTIP